MDFMLCEEFYLLLLSSAFSISNQQHKVFSKIRLIR